MDYREIIHDHLMAICQLINKEDHLLLYLVQMAILENATSPSGRRNPTADKHSGKRRP